MEWKLENGKLTINGKALKEHPDRDVKTVIEIGERLIILINYLPPPGLERTVIAVDNDGNLIWRIKASGRVLNGLNPVTGIWMEDDRLVGYLAAGMEIIIDPANGDWKLKDPGVHPQ